MARRISALQGDNTARKVLIMGKRKHPIIDGMKKCIKCEQLLPFTEEYYAKDKYAPGGLTSRCKKCRYEAKRNWEINNPEKNREGQRAYYTKTKDSYLPRKQKWRSENRDKDRKSAREWALNNPERRKHYAKLRISLPHIKITSSIRSRMRRAVKNSRFIYNNIEEELGYTIEQLKVRLESTFAEGMNWGNHSFRGWHIDHIRPVASFNFMQEDGQIDKEQVKACWALDNLQALWGEDNMRKSAKWEGF